MAPKRGRLNKVDKEQTPRKKQLKFDDEQEQEREDEDDKQSKTDSKDDSKDDYDINQIVKESNKAAAAKTDEEKAAAAKTDEEKAAVVIVEEDEDGLEKKPLINRLWSFDDEILVLQALVDFNGDNYKNQDDFFNFVQGKLNYTKFTKAQVKDKVQKLKKKYKKNLNKKSSGLSDPHFPNPHDLKSFQLSKRIWANLDANNEKDIIRVDDENKGKVEKDVSNEEEKDLGRLYPHLIKGLEGECLPKVMPLDVFKTYFSKVDSMVLEMWDREWKKLHLAEIEAYLRRLALIQEQTTWFYNQMKSS